MGKYLLGYLRMSMVESFLAEIYGRLRGKHVGVIIDGQNLSSRFLPLLPKLRDKVKELGEIKIAEVFYENSIPKKDFEYLRQSGFSDHIVPGNIELAYLLEIYDLVLDEKVDFLILGTHREELIPLYTELRKNVTVFALIDNLSSVSRAFEESFDGIIEIEKIDEFSFNSPQFSELDQLIQNVSNGRNDPNGNDATSDYTGSQQNVVDDTNIGTFSEDYIEDEELIEEMKKENQE